MKPNKCPDEMPDREEPKAPRCHFLRMVMERADDGAEAVVYWECRVCGHTKEYARWLAG